MLPASGNSSFDAFGRQGVGGLAAPEGIEEDIGLASDCEPEAVLQQFIARLPRCGGRPRTEQIMTPTKLLVGQIVIVFAIMIAGLTVCVAIRTTYVSA